MTAFCTVDINTDVRNHTKNLPRTKEDGLEICRIQDINIERCFTRSYASKHAKVCGIDGLKPSDFVLPCFR